jgi:dipeptidyl aminopeptidase/acylaminoacyl peptidase
VLSLRLTARAGIARSGSYNKTTQPFGFQSERRSLFQARDTYVQVSPTFFADQVNEPVLVIHGDSDSNPGTLTSQSEVFFEGVRGSGGPHVSSCCPREPRLPRRREHRARALGAAPVVRLARQGLHGQRMSLES